MKVHMYESRSVRVYFTLCGADFHPLFDTKHGVSSRWKHVTCKRCLAKRAPKRRAGK